MLAADELAGLVGGDRHEPGPGVVVVPERGELPPGDPPGRLGGVLGQAFVAADDEGHPDEIQVVGADEPGEGTSSPAMARSTVVAIAALSRARLVMT